VVMRVRCAWNALKVQTVLPPVLSRNLVQHDNAPACCAAVAYNERPWPRSPSPQAQGFQTQPGCLPSSTYRAERFLRSGSFRRLGDATRRLPIAATVEERVAVFEAVEASHLALRLSHRP